MTLRAWPRRVARRAVVATAALLAGGWLGERLLDLAWPFPIEALARGGASTVVRAADGSVLRVTADRLGERCLPTALDDVAPLLLTALQTAEDRRFAAHGGVDLLALVRAAWASACAGRVVSGGSTLSMQLVRIAEPRPRTLRSKLVELLRARQLERRLSKRELLEAYVARVPLGGVRGFEAAAWRWFGRRCVELLPAEAALLVAMLPAPSRLRPDRAPAELRARRDRLLDELHAAGHLDEAAWQAARATPLPAAPQPWPFLAPWACEAALYEAPNATRRDGGEVATAIDRALQERLDACVAAADPAGADGVAAVVVRRSDGAFTAISGGRRFACDRSHAALARRDAGSTLKPFLVALALEGGVASSREPVVDAPRQFGDFAPRNFDDSYRGAQSLREALLQSRNVPAVALLADVGAAPFGELLGALGLEPGARPLDLTAALGTVAVAPLALARAYARFADPRAQLLVGAAARRQVVDWLAEGPPLPGFPASRAVAWKTGTSSGRRDAWCVAIGADHVVVVWKGNLAGGGAADLVGVQTAAPLCAAVVALLP
ncbi:MAG: transglycosylase domain-containing protein [Planctomycetes bacterium]|nr:transglycosylase domain-containing protein [Planctomycetota bacterium]